MKAAKGFITTDYWIQTVLGIACLALSLVLYGIILLLPFGIWQVISSLVLVLGYGDKQRIPHLIFVVIWGIILSLFLLFELDAFPFLFFYIILLPACIGVWYYTITRKDYRLLKGRRKENKEEMEEILDVEL